MSEIRLPTKRPHRQPRIRLWPTLVLTLLLASSAAAQPAYPPPSEKPDQIHIAANEQDLWLAVSAGSQSKLFYRAAESGFTLRAAMNLRIGAVSEVGRDVLVIFEDGSAYRYDPSETTEMVAARLPQNHVPIDIVGERGRAYAVILSTAAAGLPLATTDEPTPDTQPYDPGGAPLSLAVYDRWSWKAVVPLPTIAKRPTDELLRPRLCLVQDTLMLFTPADRPDHVFYFYLNDETKSWVSCGTIGPPNLTAFWAVNFGRVPTLVGVSLTAAGEEKLTVLRLSGDVTAAEAGKWRPAKDLRLSDLPSGVTLASYAGAFAFNQHLGLLAIDTEGAAYLRFARIGGPPVEPTQPIANILSEPATLQRSLGVVQMFTLVILLLVLMGLFVFRRGSMVQLIELPPGCTLAPSLQRMFAWLIDFVPFTFAAAVTLDVSWSAGLRTLATWGISPTPGPEGGLPDKNVLIWWGLSVFGYTMYTLIMELITRRTVGKVLLGLRLLSEAGTSPTGWQILARNLTRLIEFMPQFWVFVILVLLSRNRQRMGDIFARTVVVRLVAEQPAAGTKNPPGAPPDKTPERDHEDHPASHDDDGSDSPGEDSSDRQD